MLKRPFYLMAGCGLAAVLLSLGLAASPTLDSAASRYPGSVQVANVAIDWHTLGQGALRWQATYQTSDPLPKVRGWYAARFQLSPASDQYLTGSDGCAWLSQSALLARFQHTVSVLLCALPAGTRIAVNESLELEN